MAIANRLNADPTMPRPATAKTWTASSVSAILARFTELEEERAAIGAQLAKLGRDRQSAPDLDLLDPLPIVADLMAGLPSQLYAQIYDVFGIAQPKP